MLRWDPRAGEGRAGGDDAFYDTYLAPLEGRMLRAVWRIVRDPERARDALQDALTIVWRRRDRVRSHPNAEALILRICLDAAVDTLRKERRRQRLADPGTLTPPEPEPPAGPPEAAERREVVDEVQAAIARLPGRQAAAVLMRVVEEEGYPAIARALGCSQVTARIHVMRGRAKLMRMLAHLAPLQTRRGGAR